MERSRMLASMPAGGGGGAFTAGALVHAVRSTRLGSRRRCMRATLVAQSRSPENALRATFRLWSGVMRFLVVGLVVLAFAGCTLDDGIVDGGSFDAGVVGDGGPGPVTLTGQNAFGDAGAFE